MPKLSLPSDDDLLKAGGAMLFAYGANVVLNPKAHQDQFLTDKAGRSDTMARWQGQSLLGHTVALALSYKHLNAESKKAMVKAMAVQSLSGVALASYNLYKGNHKRDAFGYTNLAVGGALTVLAVAKALKED